ncbi:hypothetical protein [Flavobacterium aurantiibacter]|uniref:Outer membrane protein beta-barrel domain-containing protein n=1 Tax=Flavobacterium aurantiibacter TaxID=2023067 RepID=A0A256A7W4_9FLAO|nr:hypothetical protein [Flavobacterium aurantiibacter]OYQ49689.1 hypothetical protein CHX27_01235 [Flavobacterium aurantiibacter]
MKRLFFLLFLLGTLAANAQSKFGFSGAIGGLDDNSHLKTMLNATLEHDLKPNLTLGADMYTSRFSKNGETLNNNQVFLTVEYRPSALQSGNKKFYLSLLAGPGLVFQKIANQSSTEYSTLLASKIGWRITNSTTIGLKQGFLLNSINNAAFVSVFVSIRF